MCAQLTVGTVGLMVAWGPVGTYLVSAEAQQQAKSCVSEGEHMRRRVRLCSRVPRAHTKTHP